MAFATPNYVAQGDISPSRFVMSDGSTDFGIVQATANAVVRGISQEGTREAPIPSVTTPLAAKAGESLRVYGETQECLLELGGTVSPGDRLKGDADGKGVAIATTGTTVQNIGAVAMEGGSSGDKIRVQVSISEIRPALS